jgi:hypothetical protein
LKLFATIVKNSNRVPFSSGSLKPAV